MLHFHPVFDQFCCVCKNMTAKVKHIMQLLIVYTAIQHNAVQNKSIILIFIMTLKCLMRMTAIQLNATKLVIKWCLTYHTSGHKMISDTHPSITLRYQPLIPQLVDDCSTCWSTSWESSLNFILNVWEQNICNQLISPCMPTVSKRLYFVII